MPNFLKKLNLNLRYVGIKSLILLLFSYEKLIKVQVTRCEFIFLFLISDLEVIVINNSRVFGISTSFGESCYKLCY